MENNEYLFPTERKKLINLNTIEYEHPIETKALKLLRSNKTIEKAIKVFFEYKTFKQEYIKISGSFFQITEQSLPEIFENFKIACNILDINPIPKLYIIENTKLDAYTTCIDSPVVVIYSSLLKILNKDERIYVLGHELGHIKSNHLLYSTLLLKLSSVIENKS